MKGLEWRKWSPRDTGNTAETVVGSYHVWTHHEANGRWFWRLAVTGLGPIIDNGDCASEAEATAAAQADYEARILTAIEPVAASPGVGAVNDGEIRLDEGALKAAMAAKPWPAREYTVALLMEQGGCGTETLSAAIRAYLAAAPASPEPSPSTEDVMGAMSWALGEIDVLSNKLCGFAYPQGMGMLGRRSAAQEDAYENAVKVRALSSKQRSGE